MDALQQQIAEALAQHTQQATQAAQQAGQQYQQAAQQPAPDLGMFQALIPALFGNVASVLSGNPSYQQEGQQQVKQSRAQLLQQRADNLQALQDVFKQKAEAAQKAGDFEAEATARTKLEALSKTYDLVKQNADHTFRSEQSKLDRENKLAVANAKPAGGGGVYGQSYSATDPKAIAEGIQRGDLPPNLSQYSRLAQGPVATELAKSGFNLSRAQQDFSAVKAHFTTLNGRLQTQIRQSATTVMPGLDDVVSLATRLNELSPSTRNTPINKLLVKGSREWGLMSPEAQQVATELNGQVATLIPEMSNIYSAGGVPSDKAMQLAERVLSADWPLNRIVAGVNREKKNLQYRINSINQVGALTPTSSEGGGFQPAPAESPGLISVTAPNKKTYHFTSQAQADAFKKRAGIP